MTSYYPVCLDVAGKKCVVIGGGEVAERKISSLLESQAQVVVVSQDLTSNLQRWRDEGRLTCLQRPYRDGDLSQAFLAIAATDDRQTNRAVAVEAHRRGVLINVVDDAPECDFTLPATIRRGDLTVAVSTGGRSPAMARYMREELESFLAPEHVTLLEMAAEVRAELRGQGLTIPPETWREALEATLPLVRQGDLTHARAQLKVRLMGGIEGQEAGSPAAELIVVGLSHQAAPVEVRERLAFSSAQQREALPLLLQRVREAAILSTCNRTEIYAVADQAEAGVQEVEAFLEEFHRVPRSSYQPYLYRCRGREAASHLFRVASGLDSMILGEPQILGQVRECYETAVERNAAGPILSRAFHQALKVGKQVRNRTDICRSAVSVSYAAVELARRVLGSLDNRSVLLIGAGRMGELAAQAMADDRATRVVVTNRTYARAADLAAQLGGEAAEFERLPRLLGEADVVITSTGAPSFILTPAVVREALRGRGERPLVLIDIAVPRDVDPEVKGLPNVWLHDIDDLQSVCVANLEERRKEVSRAQEIVEGEVEAFQVWWSSLPTVPTISALRQRAEDIRQVELQEALNRLGDLNGRQREVVDALSCTIVNKILHRPITRLKERGGCPHGAEYARVLRELFALPGES